MTTVTAHPAQQPNNHQLYLPIVHTTLCGSAPLPRVNAPGFGANPIPFGQTAIAWFGALSPDSNYVDVRVGYNNQELYVYLAIFDRHLWYDENPTLTTLTQWDAATLLLDTSGGNQLSLASWRFVSQLYSGASPAHRAVYRGSGSGWQAVNISFDALPGWRGGALNDNAETDRGWAMGFTIPFSSLGLSGPPAQGAQWRMALIVHDRDAMAGPVLTDQRWPSVADVNSPLCWGWLHFGLPTHSATGVATQHTVIRRPTQNSPLVPDADVGGATANQCPGDDDHIWNQWANLNHGNQPDFNIQNQSDVADWPCFAKYYVTFPLLAIPSGSAIISATVTLHQFGNSGGPGQAQPSWVQALQVAGDWQEATITWNNAPQALENISGAWVHPLSSTPPWPGVPRVWDVSYAVAQALARGEPLRLAFYSADSDYHSGKYFVSSDTGDWNTEGRPRLDVWWRP